MSTPDARGRHRETFMTYGVARDFDGLQVLALCDPVLMSDAVVRRNTAA
jgi:hypothetical protein